jgi:23S rRNA (adenine2503-C2)-methyltransferase
VNFLSMTIPELRSALAALGEPPYRALQLADWVYRKGVTDPARMTNLPAALAQRFIYLTSRVAARSESADGTLKLLVDLADGERVETVLIPTERFATACLSTQVGCPVGCAFCASGLEGLKRNLAAEEILEQLLHLRQAAGRRISHVVFMGMGEPLANYKATVAAIRAITDPERFGLSARHVTVSTVGLPKAIRRLAAEDLPITLAVSLHAPDDALRRRLVPGASPLGEVLAAAQAFFQSRGREVTLEYVLLAGVNDSRPCADRLADLARPIRCSVNVIPFNPVPGVPFERPSQAGVRAFADRLRRRGINVHVRRSRGADAEAACGQLRRAGPPNVR